MIFRSLHLRFLLLIFAISANAAAALTSEEQRQKQQPDEDITRADIKPAGPTSLRGPSINNRDLKNGAAQKKDDIFVHGCNDNYDPSSNKQYLCKQVVAYSNGGGNKDGVIKNICKTIDEIYDSNIVVDVLQMAGLFLNDVLDLPEGDLKACILAAYEMLPSSAPSDVPSLEPSATPSSMPSSTPSSKPSSTPSSTPSSLPSTAPTAKPSSMPSSSPSDMPSTGPSAAPSLMPSSSPSNGPSLEPSATPSLIPSASPSSKPSSTPTGAPSNIPSEMPSEVPSSKPSTSPSAGPTQCPVSSEPSPRPFAAAYMRSNIGSPMGSTTNEVHMDAVFGGGAWDDLRFETFDIADIHTYTFIFMEGSGHAGGLRSFLIQYLPCVEDWVARGGRLFLNAAVSDVSPGNIDFGFGGVLNWWDWNIQSVNIAPAALAHPIFSGPFLPVLPGSPSFSGSPFALSVVTRPLSGIDPIIVDSTNPNRFVLAEKTYQNGLVVFGGMTPTDTHNPQNEAFNLRKNILWYTAGIDNVLNFQPCPAGTGFSPIAVFGTRLDTISSNDDRTEFVSLPFQFPWFGETRNSIYVSSNGLINMAPGDTSSYCCSARPFPNPSSFMYNANSQRISVAHEDLDPGGDNIGDIYTYVTIDPMAGSVTISWEEVEFFPSGGEVNAQATLFSNGEVHICWGTGNTNGNSLAAGIQGPNSNDVFPAITFPTNVFFPNGIVSTYPTNRCACFLN